jgi:hypothetical protein
MSAENLEDVPGDRTSRDPLAKLPKYSEFVFLRLPGSEICCDQCGECRAQTKGYTVPYILFVLRVFYRFRWVVKCPRCMRFYLASRLPLALLMANMASPMILVWWAFLFVRTFLR